MSRRDHWEGVYQKKSATDVSWYRPHLENSVDLIADTGVAADGRIIDVGGGASTLVDDLLGRGFRNVTVVDLAESALAAARERLGARADGVTWLAGDITEIALPPGAFDVWHDRAVFHFLTEPEQREAYVRQVCRAVRPGGHVIVASFGPEGPEKCSGLPVVRYSPDDLHAEFGRPFQLLRHLEETHQTPWGSTQEFVYCLCVKQGECEAKGP